MNELDEMYNDLIMEHSMNSYNKKKLDSCDFCEKGHNPNCGDEIEIQIKLGGENKDIIDLYYKNFGENSKLEVLNQDGFKGKSDSFDSFIVDIYSYNLEDRVVLDYKKLNDLHKIDEYYFFGFEHFLLSCPTSEIAFVYVPEYWTEALERVYRQLMDNGYINDFVPIAEEKVMKILLEFKKIL